MCSADSARICASGHGHPPASPRWRAAHYHDEGVQQQERYSIEEQARDDRRDRRAVATGESPPAAPGPERVADTERRAEWHLAAPGDVRAASGKIAFGHRVAADPVPDPATAGLTIRHRVEDVLVLRAGHICPRVHFGGQDSHGDTSHRDEQRPARVRPDVARHGPAARGSPPAAAAPAAESSCPGLLGVASAFKHPLESGEVSSHGMRVALEVLVAHTRESAEREHNLTATSVCNYPYGHMDDLTRRQRHVVIEDTVLIPRGEGDADPSRRRVHEPPAIDLLDGIPEPRSPLGQVGRV